MVRAARRVGPHACRGPHARAAGPPHHGPLRRQVVALQARPYPWPGLGPCRHGLVLSLIHI
eukprot:6956250-Alexandrium_andersonii.AAC.1